MSERKVKPGSTSAAGPGRTQGSERAFTHWLIRQAAGRAPPDLSERLEEEWRADMAARSSAGSRLRFALGCCWATRVIAREYCPSRIPAATAVAGPKGAFGYVRNDSGFFARRSFTFFLVAGLHIALFYGLMTGLAFKIIKAIPTSLELRMTQPPQARPVLPIPPPRLTRPTFEIPILTVPPTADPFETEVLTDSFIPTVPAAGYEAPTANPAHEVIRVQGGPGIGFPATEDYYPSIAKRLEEQGVTTVRVCVDAGGRLTSAPIIAQTSGSSRLDDGALLLAKAGSGHYRAATEDGRAVDSCYPFRVRFALKASR